MVLTDRHLLKTACQQLILLFALLPVDDCLAFERPFRNWMELKHVGVEHQQQDYSCGIAALATILKYSYGVAVSEATLLEDLKLPHIHKLLPVDWRQRGVSMAVLAALAESREFKALGVTVPLSALYRLQVPAIVFMRFQGLAHFSVIRGVSRQGWVHLADPSWGNRHLTMDQFAALWDLEIDALNQVSQREHSEVVQGALLLLMPQDSHHVLDRRYFQPTTPRPLMLPSLTDIF